MQGTTTERQTIVGVFPDRAAAEGAVRRLEESGFGENQVGIVGPQGDRGESGGGTTHAEPKGAMAGIPTGAVAGGVLGALAAGLIPGIGPIIGGGILAGVLGGAVAGGAVGGVAGALVGAGVPEQDAHRYESDVREGRWLVTCRGEGREQEAAQLLQASGGHVEGPISSVVSQATGTRPDHGAQTGAETMPIHEERLQTGTEQAQAGEVRLRKEVEAERQTVDVPVEREHVSVEMRDVEDRPVEHGIGEGPQEVSAPVYEERPQVRKETVVTGEAALNKQRVTEHQQVSEDVHREVPRVEREGVGDSDREV